VSGEPHDMIKSRRSISHRYLALQQYSNADDLQQALAIQGKQ